MRKLIAILALILSVTLCYPQGSANNWYFGGNAGLNFNTSPPQVLENGQLDTKEGCASISDQSGKLLFYTDGSTIYNRSHQIMENGNGLFGDASSTQSAIIIPKPRSPKIFYVFTVDNFLDDVNYGVNYSIVDFTENNYGKVTQKNINLLNYSAEKLAAVVKGCDTGTIWMMTLSTETGEYGQLNNFYAFEVSADGVDTTPVKSPVALTGEDARGNLKFSNDGSQIACANSGDGLFILDFDSETGRVSNPVEMNLSGSARFPYGVEFSPSDRFLYVHATNNANPGEFHTSSLFQIDLLNGKNDPVYTEIDFQENLYRGSLQRGPDGKIYRTMSPDYYEPSHFLSTIEKPDEAGEACDYKNNSINLGAGESFQGLPPFIQSSFNAITITEDESSVIHLCRDEGYTLGYEYIPTASYSWFLNYEPMSNITANTLDIAWSGDTTLPYTVVYTLKVDLNDGTCPLEGTVTVNYYDYTVVPVDLVLVQCESENNSGGKSLFNLNEATSQLQNGDTTLTVSFYKTRENAEEETNALNATNYENTKQDQIIYARVDNPACGTVVPLVLHVVQVDGSEVILYECDTAGNGFQSFDLTEAIPLLKGDLDWDAKISFYPTKMDALLETKASRIQSEITNETPYEHSVYARIENGNDCYGISEVKLVVMKEPEFDLEPEFTYCTNFYPQPLRLQPDLHIDANDYDFLWMPNGETTPYLDINEAGNYTLTVTHKILGCTTTKSTTVNNTDLGSIEEVVVTDASDNNTARIIVVGNGWYEYAINEDGEYQDDNYFTDLPSGFYTAYVHSKYGCGILQKQFSIRGFPTYFTPNGDGYHDKWQVDGLNTTLHANVLIRIFNRYGKLMTQISPKSDGWDGTYNGNPAPSDDYWYYVVLEDGRELKGHFTLKR